MEERTFFNQGQIWVTNARFIVPGQTYAMNAVTSVRQGVTMPSRGWPLVLILVGILCLLGGLDGGVGALLMAAIFIGIGVLIWRQQKPVWTVVLSTASGEHKALSSEDATFIQSVVTALNQAIVHRG